MPWTRTRMTTCLAAAAAAATALVLASGTPTAAGGGDWVHPARDRYEAGQRVTLIGYGSGAADALQASGPFYAWLRVDPAAAQADALTELPAWPGVHRTDLRMAPVILEDVGVPAEPTAYVEDVRLGATFDLPPDLPDGPYEVLFCNDPCSHGIGNFMSSWIHVGVDPDPASPVVRDWPLDDPAIRWLEDDALLQLPSGGSITAADVRAGEIPLVTDAPPPVAPSPAAPPASSAPAPARVQQSATAGSGATEADAETDTPAGDDRSAAWWVAGEVTFLVAGAAAALAWSGRRRTRARRGPAATAPASLTPVPTGPGPGPDDADDAVGAAAAPGGDEDDLARAGVRHASTIRL